MFIARGQNSCDKVRLDFFKFEDSLVGGLMGFYY
jgi:hypothetical protein